MRGQVGGRGYPPSALPGISPSRGEIGKKRGHHFNLRRQDGLGLATCRSPPLRGRCPAGQRGVSSAARELPALHNPKPMTLIQRNRLNQIMPILIAHMSNVDDGEWIGRLDGQDIAGLEGGELLAASQNRKGAFKPPQIINDIGRVAHSLAQNFQNGFFSGASGAGAGE
ncbi:hypothetical protein AGR8A_Lc20364 [Agrobacterium fabrum str. J-07]|nr:hypothetical protein AGR8A_Lc20364 [Agrobacterium fabrum str. J-07]